MANWIELDPQEVHQPESRLVNGVEIRVGVSPYEIPEAVRGYFDDDLDRLVIEFRYLDDDESKVIQRKDELVEFVVGQNSGCLYGIRVDVKKLKAKIVGLRLVPELDRAIANLDQTMSTRTGHYKVLRQVLANKEDDLVKEEDLVQAAGD